MDTTGQIERWHGTTGGYTNHKCRCRPCTDAFAENHSRYMARRKATGAPPELHGTVKAYAGYRCRCQPCRQAYGRSENARVGRKRPYRSREQIAEERAERDREIAEKRAAKTISYMGAHQRVRHTRGPAKRHICEFCGDTAHDWALKATAASMIRGTTSRGAEETWSGDPQDYRPLCRGCHKRYDVHVRLFGTCVEGGCEDPTHVIEARQARSVRVSGQPSVPTDRTRCPNGHDLTTPFSRRVRAYDGRTECVQCNRDRSKRYRANKSGAPKIASGETLPIVQ